VKSPPKQQEKKMDRIALAETMIAEHLQGLGRLGLDRLFQPDAEAASEALRWLMVARDHRPAA
jgi:hypothetical protein